MRQASDESAGSRGTANNSAPTQVDVYGHGNRLSDGALKSNNPAMTAAIESAYKLTQSTPGTTEGDVTVPGISDYDALKQSFGKAGLDPKLIPVRADLGAYRSIGQYNGVGGDPLKQLQETVRYDDGRSVDEANTRDRIAQGLANGQTHDQIWKNIQGYNDDHRGGWSKENLGIDGKDLATLAVIAGGVATGGFGLLGGAGAGAGTVATELAGGAALESAGASGLAGSLGMSAGYGATALNAGALNAGISLAQGHNIGDSVKSGITAAALSGVGGWAKDGIGSVLSDSGLGKEAINAIATVGSRAATGGVGGAITGQGVGQGIINGAVSGGVSVAGNMAGGWAKDESAELGSGISRTIGNAASAATQAAITGKNIGQSVGGSLINSTANYAGNEAKDATGSNTLADLTSMGVNAGLRGRNVNNSSIIASALNNGLDDWKNIGNKAGRVTLGDGTVVSG